MSLSSQFPDPAAYELPPRLRLIDWRRLQMPQGTLIGFACVLIRPPGIVVRDVTVHRSGEAFYALMPAKPVLNQDGQVVIDERGKRKYAAIVEIPDRDVRARLSAAVITLVRQHDPESLQ